MITVVCACGCVCVSYEYDESIQARKIIDSDPGQIYRSSNFLLNGNWTELGTPEDSMKLGPNTLVQTQLPTENILKNWLSTCCVQPSLIFSVFFFEMDL